MQPALFVRVGLLFIRLPQFFKHIVRPITLHSSLSTTSAFLSTTFYGQVRPLKLVRRSKLCSFILDRLRFYRTCIPSVANHKKRPGVPAAIVACLRSISFNKSFLSLPSLTRAQAHNMITPISRLRHPPSHSSTHFQKLGLLRQSAKLPKKAVLLPKDRLPARKPNFYTTVSSLRLFCNT